MPHRIRPKPLLTSTHRQHLPFVTLFALATLIALGGCEDSTDVSVENDVPGNSDGEDTEEGSREVDSDDVANADTQSDADSTLDADSASHNDGYTENDESGDTASDTDTENDSEGDADGDSDEGEESYAPAAGQEGSTAIAAADERIVAWATGHSDVSYGEEVADNWKTPEKAYGQVGGGSFGVVVLGRGGSITMTFDAPISDDDGPDFAVFENGFSDTFLELGYAEVSSDGVNFERFDVFYTGTTPVGGFGAMDPTQFTGFAGKYRSGFGTPFDLSLLKNRPAVRNGTVDLSAITHIRIVDVIGAGGADGYEAERDARGRVIYDLYPTVGSAGFDLSGIAVLNERTD